VPESGCRDIRIEPSIPNGFALAYSITSSAREPRRGDAERLLGLELDHQLGLRRLLNGQVHPY